MQSKRDLIMDRWVGNERSTHCCLTQWTFSSKRQFALTNTPPQFSDIKDTSRMDAKCGRFLVPAKAKIIALTLTLVELYSFNVACLDQAVQCAMAILKL